MKKSVGERIKQKRKELGLTQSDLSGPNLSHVMISLIERNQTTPSLKTLEIISQKLDVTLSYLLGESDIITERAQLNPLVIEKTITRSKVLINTGKPEDAKEILLSLLKEEMDSAQRTPILQLLAYIEMKKKDYTAAISCLNKALLYISPLEAKFIEIYIELANCYRHQKDYYLCMEHALYGRIILKTKYYLYEPLHLLKLLYNLAYSYSKLGRYEKASECADEALQIMEQSSIYYKEGPLYMIKGLSEMFQSNYDLGIDYTKTALSKIKSGTEPLQRIGCLTNIGYMYKMKKKYPEAIAYLKQSLDLSLDQNHSWHISNNYLELSLCHFFEDNHTEADKLIRSGLASSADLPYFQSKFLLLYGQLLKQQNRNEEALLSFRKCETLSSVNGLKELTVYALYLQSELFREEGKLTEANMLLRSALPFKDESLILTGFNGSKVPEFI